MASIALQSARLQEFQTDPDEQVLFNEVVTTLNDLGHYNSLTKKYQLNLTDHGACLRDLIRYLRNDGQIFLVRRQMGLSNIVEHDLLPIVEQHTLTAERSITEKGKSLMDKIVRLLVDLTNPTVLHYKDQKIPKEDKHEMNIYMELQGYLFLYKLSFSLHKRFWAVLCKFLTRILELDTENRQVEDELMMERIIILVRNVLHIPIVSQNKGSADDDNVHDRIIEHMNSSGLLDIFQYMISSGEYNQYCFHLLEIMFLMFREQNAEFLAKSVGSDRMEAETNNASQQSSGSYRSQFEREYDRKEFEKICNRDKQENIQLLHKIKGGDFTRFKETAFIVKNIKAVSDRDMICYKAYIEPEKAIDFNRNKMAQRRPRNRRPMNESVGNSDSFGTQRIHRSDRKIRSILYDFCAKFLAESYNRFMDEIRANLIRGSAQEHDETYFFWASQFFMEFNRYQPNITREQRYRQIHQTLCTSMFHYIQTKVDDYIDHLLQKKEFKHEVADWSKRLHQALRSYRELLYSLSSIESLNLPEAFKMCHRVKTDIFTEPEYREMLLRLIQSYNEEKMSKAYLRDLIETNHMFIKMLEYHAKISFDFKIKIKKRKQKRKEKVKSKENGEVDQQVNEGEGVQNDDVSPETIWMEIIDQIGEVLNTELNAETILKESLLKDLFDPLSDRSQEEQILAIMRQIKRFLMAKKVREAVSLYREARNVLSGVDEDNVFGEPGIEKDEEMTALNGILMTEFPKEKTDSKKKQTEKDDDEPESDEADDDTVQIQEKAFSIEDTLMRYAHPNVVRTCRLLLRNFRTNSAETNHALVKLLYRIGVTLKMKPMFYNLGYFLLFEQIMEDPVLQNPEDRKSDYYKSLAELYNFSFYIVRSFFKLLAQHPKIASEICFIVNSREAYSMEYGFEEQVVSQMIRQKKGLAWSEEQLLELEVLYKEYKEKATKEKDVVDLIQEHLIDETKTRRQIINQLKKMDLLETKDIKKNSYKGPAWSEDELKELKDLYEKFKDNLEIEEIQEEVPAVVPRPIDPELTTMIEISSVTDSQRERELNDSEEKIDDQSEVLEKRKKKSKKRLDVIDCILKHLSTSATRNRRQIIRQLKLSNIYDHSAGKKWAPELVEELRAIFCNLFIDFKQIQMLDSITDQDAELVNEIVPETNVTKDNFMDKLMERFSDKTKSTRQIIGQLKKMNLFDNLKTVGIVKEKSETNEQNDDISSDDSDDPNDGPEEHPEDGEQVVIQYDDEDDSDEGKSDDDSPQKDQSIPEIKKEKDTSFISKRRKKFAELLSRKNIQSPTVEDSNSDNETANKKQYRKIRFESDDESEETFNSSMILNETSDFTNLEQNEQEEESLKTISKRKIMDSDDEEQDEPVSGSRDDELLNEKKKRKIAILDDDDEV